MPDDLRPERESRPFRRDPPATIGEYAVHAASNEIAGSQGVIRLRPRLMDVLLRLAATPGEVVTRQALLDDVWPRRVVADEVLSRTIGELRTALGDDAREARYIETLPKVGYRLIAPVDTAHAGKLTSSNLARDPAPAAPEAGAAIAVAAPTAASMPIAAALPSRGRRWRTVAPCVLAVCAIAAATLGWRQYVRHGAFASSVAALSRQLNDSIQFASDVEMEVSPRLSPDGSRVAYVMGTENRAVVIVQEVANRTRTTFGDADATYLSPAWFPDGQRLAYYRRQGRTCAIVERDLAQGTERTLVDCERAPGPRFDLAPDGTRLVYSSLRERDAGLRLLDLRTLRTTPLTSPASDAGIDTLPRFSPDGKRVAFNRGVHGQSAIWIVPVDKPADAQALGSPSGLILGLAWAGNDGPLVVGANWTGFRALDALDVATGKTALLGARNGQFPDVGAHGEIVYETAAYAANLQLLDVDDPARSPRPLWPSARYTNYPQFSPDGQRLVFVSNRDNVASLFVGTPGGDMHRLPLPAEYVFAQPHWSHDGRALYAVRGSADPKDETQQAVLIDPQSGHVDVLAALGDRVSDVRDSDDGSRVYFGVTSGPLMQLWRAPAARLADRERLPLPLVDAFDVVGRTLAYSQPRAQDITVCALPELRCTPAGLPPMSKTRMGWALAADALWISDTDETSGELLRFDLARRAVNAHLPHAPSAIGPNLAIAPDERHAVISRAEPPAIDLMLAPAH